MIPVFVYPLLVLPFYTLYMNCNTKYAIWIRFVFYFLVTKKALWTLLKCLYQHLVLAVERSIYLRLDVVPSCLYNTSMSWHFQTWSNLNFSQASTFTYQTAYIVPNLRNRFVPLNVVTGGPVTKAWLFTLKGFVSRELLLLANTLCSPPPLFGDYFSTLGWLAH